MTKKRIYYKVVQYQVRLKKAKKRYEHLCGTPPFGSLFAKKVKLIEKVYPST